MLKILTGNIAIAIALNSLLLCDWAAASDDDRMTFVFECANPSIPPKAMFNQIFELSHRQCDFWKTIEPGNPNDLRYQVYYQCARKFSECPNEPSPRCELANKCCCGTHTTYAAAMCEYDLFSMSRLWNSCTPNYYEMNMRETIESVDESEQIYDMVTDHIQLTGRTYCNDGQMNLIIHPCCVPPLMLVIDKGECLQKVFCGTRREAVAPFKVAWKDSDGATIGSWTGPLIDAWDRLRPWPKFVLNRAIGQLDECVNVTGRVSVVGEDQCARCKAQKAVMRLYEMGHTVKL
ncbi:uncharacterized protein LOC129594591 [Paramacrobiotus metropolitanus]|uniref:uncharacterized protein LOC129594591 n=1 Tax=Paramacrobiotus metropolitanus TaxID=2943436 RepID=UPI002445F03C|nr:uncharacterized protein LOC129594591 [Paramacrobiotus metropolitanus]